MDEGLDFLSLPFPDQADHWKTNKVNESLRQLLGAEAFDEFKAVMEPVYLKREHLGGVGKPNVVFVPGVMGSVLGGWHCLA